MGMFDRLYDEKGNEWQTKAFDCFLDSYRPGDRIGAPFTYQVEVFGGRPDNEPSVDSYATVRDGILISVDDPRDETLPLLAYNGGWIAKPQGA